MKYIPFTEFLKNNYLIIEAIEYTDKTLFSRIVNEEFTPTEDELTKLDIELSNPETAKKYLDNEEELELIKKYKADPTGQEGLDARNTVIENKLKWIYLLANKAVNAGSIKKDQVQDAVQNAVLYLIRGIDKFDPDKGVPFTAYSKQWILAGIKNPFNPVRQKSISADTQGRDGIGVTSIDTPINTNGDDKEGTVADVIPDSRDGINPFDVVDDQDAKIKLNIFLKKLPEKQAKAIELRFIPNDGNPRTLEEIGKELGMTKMGAKNLIERALDKLKIFAKEENIKL